MKDSVTTLILCLIAFLSGLGSGYLLGAFRLFGNEVEVKATSPETSLVEALATIHREHAVALDLAYQLGEKEQTIDFMRSRHREEIRKVYEEHNGQIPDWLR